MKKFLAVLVVAALAGTSVAWVINYRRFAARPAYFGPLTMTVSMSDVMAERAKLQNVSKARVELLDELNYDFGVMSPNSEGEHIFRVKNVGEGKLTLKLGATTCKCTLGELDNSSLAPGEETEIKLSWSVKEGTADFSQTAQVITNDPTRVVLTFGISGKVISDIDVVPDTWTFGEVATGEPIELGGTIYNFMSNDIKPTEMRFSSQEMTDLATFDVEPYQPTAESDGAYVNARQAFRVKVNIAPGMRQGAVSQNFMFGFVKLDENGQEIATTNDGSEEQGYYAIASTQGRVIGSLSMLPNSKITGEPGGGYLFDIGKIGKEDPLVVKSFVVLKGEERENTTLRVGNVVPSSVIKATLGEPKGRGSMTLYPLEIEFTPGPETVQRLGSSGDDYGQVVIESDNPKVTKMRIALKFSVDGR